MNENSIWARVLQKLGRFNYWRDVQECTSNSACQVACASNPCTADPTCNFDDKDD